ncbi:MAG: hypothetical protein GY771_03025 [bacterium]|nr:hypothetical protein [bacterium]
MRYLSMITAIATAAILAVGCMQIISLDQPYDAKVGKEFVTTITVRTPEAEEPAEGEEPTETFSYGVLAFAVPDDWEVTGIKTVEGELSPTWSAVPTDVVDPAIGYDSEELYGWKVFLTDESFSSIEQAKKTFTVDVKIKPAAKGMFELGYASGAVEVESAASLPFTPSWGTNEVNGGSVIYKRIWVK